VAGIARRPDSVQVIAGLGGVGKSALALALCARARRQRWWHRRRLVWWLSAADHTSLTGGMIGLARQLGASEQALHAIAQGAADGPDRLWALLQQARRGWLLVIDNADEPNLLAAATPTGGSTQSTTVADGTGWIRPTRRGLVVVTSRVSDRQIWGPTQTDVYRLGVLSPEDATAVLLDLIGADDVGDRRRRGADDRDAAWDLAVRLGGLPLALHLAGTAIGSQLSAWASVADYQAALDTAGAELLEPDPDTPLAADPRAAVARTWELSLDALAAHGLPHARSLLRLLSCYAPAVPIPASLLADAALGELLAGPEQPTVRELVRARHALARVGLIDVVDLPDPAGEWQAIVIHPLVAETNRSYLVAAGTDATAVTAVRHAAVTLLAHAAAPLDFVNASGASHWSWFRLLAPHVPALLTSVAADLPAADLAVLLDVVARMVHFHVMSGAFQVGRELGRSALAHTHRVGDDHPAAIYLRFRFARSLMRLGHMEQAVTQYGQVVDDMARVLGPDHPETLIVRSNLVAGALWRGRWEQAETEFRCLLGDMARALGPDHIYTLSTRFELARVIGISGRWPQAEADLRQVAYDLTRAIGPDDPETLIARRELGRAVGETGQWGQAEADFRQVVDDTTRVLGPDHPHTLAARRELGRAVGETGQWGQAEADFRQVVDDTTRVLGPDHPETLIARRELGRAVGETGQWGQAEADFRQVVDDTTRVLGPDHPHTLAARRELGRAVGETGQWGQAEADFRQVVDDTTRVLGPDHPHTLMAHRDLAAVVGGSGQTESS
jgi:hypothetical protein